MQRKRWNKTLRIPAPKGRATLAPRFSPGRVVTTMEVPEARPVLTHALRRCGEKPKRHAALAAEVKNPTVILKA